MDLTVNEYIDGLLSEEAHQSPSDSGRAGELKHKMKLPEWFDEEKYNQGRLFYQEFCLSFGFNLIMALVAAFSVPSITKILAGGRRSNSIYPAYKRYVSTLMHVASWHDHELKPGTLVWRSLELVRARHLGVSKDASLKGRGVVSQRDVALSQAVIMGFAFLKPHKFSIKQLKKGDWDGYNHFWKTMGFMIGLEDRYNVCRNTVDETREVVRIIIERVFTPCLENVPEYFNHCAEIMLASMGSVSHDFESRAVLFRLKCLAGVPGYVYHENDRMDFQDKLKKQLKGKSEDVGVDTADLMCKSGIDGLPTRPPRLLYVRDFDSIDTTPAYKQLTFAGRYRLAFFDLVFALYSMDVARYILNAIYRFSLLISFYFPFKVFLKYGLRGSYVNMFADGPKDDTKPIPNSEYNKPAPPDTWYGKLFVVLW